MNNIIFIEDQNFELVSKWDKFVASHPGGQIYFTTDWLKIIQQESGEKLIRLACVDDDENILGVLPLMTTKGFPFGMGGVAGSARLSSLPRTPIGGPLSFSSEVDALLIDEAILLLQKFPRKILQLKSMSDKLNNSKNDLVCVPWRESYLLDIPVDSLKEIRYGDSKNHTKIKTGINKSLSSGVKFGISTDISDLKEWYKLFLDTMQQHCTPARSLMFFQNLWVNFYDRGMMKLYTASYENKMIAGSILFYFGKNVTYAFNGSDKEFLNLRPNDLIHWHAIIEAQQNGFSSYDFGEVSKNDAGLAAYKKKWGTKIVQIYHYYFPEQISLYGNEIDIESAEGLKQKIIKRLPSNIFAHLGEWTYKYL